MTAADRPAADRLAEIEARFEAATDGPWVAVMGASGGWWVEQPNTATIADIDVDYSGNPDANAHLIAHARTDLPATMKALRAVLELHKDGGESPGYTENDYEDIAHCCTTCGSFGEYGEPYPCDTVRAITEALDGAS